MDTESLRFPLTCSQHVSAFKDSRVGRPQAWRSAGSLTELVRRARSGWPCYGTPRLWARERICFFFRL